MIEKISPVRKNFIYNVSTPSEDYINIYNRGKVFDEHIQTSSSPREAWANMLLTIQKEKIEAKKKDKEFVGVVFIPSIEALQSKSQKHFNQFVDDVIKNGCTLFSQKEQAFFTKVHPNGIANDMKALKTAQKKLQDQWNSANPGIEILSVKRKMWEI